MASHDRHGRRQCAMRDGNASVGWNSNRRRDSGNDFELDACSRDRFSLLATPPEDEWIAPFQPNHDLAGPSPLDQQLIDVLLLAIVPAPSPADIDALGTGRREFQ